MLIDKIKNIVNHYDNFKQTAIGLEWIKIKETHFEWYNKYPDVRGILMHLYEIPEGHIRNHFEQAFVRVIMGNIIHDEELAADFWDISEDERKNIFHLAENGINNVYETYSTYKELRLKPVSKEYLQSEIEMFCDKNTNDMIQIDNFINYIKNAENIELGGSYGGDFSYISVSDKTILFIECGCWD